MSRIPMGYFSSSPPLICYNPAMRTSVLFTMVCVTLSTASTNCGDNPSTNDTTTGAGAGGMAESSSSSGIAGTGGTGGNGGAGGSGGTGGGCVAFYEDCTTLVDENCDGQSPTCSGDGLWAKAFGDAEWGDTAWVATDAKGNVFVATNFLGQTIDFGGSVFVSQGADITLALLAPNGDHLWSKRFGDVGEQVIRTMRDDKNGGVVLAGHFGNSLDFGSGPLTAPQFAKHPFVARIDGTGKQVFSRSFSGSTSYEVHAVAAGSDGGTVIGGCGPDALDLGVGAPPQAAWSGFVARLSPTGQTLWAQTFTSDGPLVCVEGVALDKLGHVAITGVFEGTVDLGGGPVTSAGGYDAFVMKFDNMGNTVFRKTAGGMGAQSGVDIQFDSAGDVIATGTYQNAIDWGAGQHTTTASTSAFLTRFDGAGNAKWSKGLGNGGDLVARTLLIDPAGHMLLTGGFFATVDFDDGPVTSKGLNDLFVVKLDGAGKLIWKKVAGDGDVQEGGSVAVDSAGHVFVGGRIWSAVDVGTGSVPSHGKDDALVAKLKP